MKIVFMGTPHAAAASLDRLVRDSHEIVSVYTQPDRPAGRGNRIAYSPVKQYAIDKGLKLRQPTKIRTAEALAELQADEADVAVVVAYGRILPATFLNAFPMGAINVHFSLLPKFRGAAPVNWAIVHGERTTGVTTMRMDEGLDTGPILLQRETEIGDDETSIELMERLAMLGADLLSETLRRYTDLTPIVQDELEANYAPIMKKEDGLISWMLNARQITDRVRGFQPFPTAFTYFREKKLTIWKCRNAMQTGQDWAVGQIVAAESDVLCVKCGGDTYLCIEELQLEGKRRVSARDFINGVRPLLGETLG